PRHRVLVPAFESRRVGAEDDADPPGEPAPLGLDEVAEHLLGAPLARRWMPSAELLGEGTELGGNHPCSSVDQRGRLGGGQRSHWARPPDGQITDSAWLGRSVMNMCPGLWVIMNAGLEASATA